MARPRNHADTPFSLFPFLSVLTCAMGVLIVIISGQNLIAIGTADQIIELSDETRGRQPRFVECTREGIVIHPHGRRVPLDEVNLDAGSAFGELVKELKADDSERYLVLLIRTDGIDSFYRCRYLARKSKIDMGKDAVPGRGRLIFTTGGKPVLAARPATRPDTRPGDPK